MTYDDDDVDVDDDGDDDNDDDADADADAGADADGSDEEGKKMRTATYDDFLMSPSSISVNNPQLNTKFGVFNKVALMTTTMTIYLG